MIRVLFVCMGNICRSPLAEGIFVQLLKAQGLTDRIQADSAGTTASHAGEWPDLRSRRAAESHGFALTHRSRMIREADLELFDYIIVMDAANERYTRMLKNSPKYGHKILKMRLFDDKKSQLDVEDPYWGDQEDFDICYQILHESCTNLLAHIRKNHGL